MLGGSPQGQSGHRGSCHCATADRLEQPETLDIAGYLKPQRTMLGERSMMVLSSLCIDVALLLSRIGQSTPLVLEPIADRQICLYMTQIGFTESANNP